MNRVKQHYEEHLGHFYSWMVGPFEARVKEAGQLLDELELQPEQNRQAIDLGAGHGIFTVALSQKGFLVTAIDFNTHLVDELVKNSSGLNVKVREAGLTDSDLWGQPELILCMGDTITHLESKQAIKKLLQNCYDALPSNGKLLLSFRDYTAELKGDARFIPVKSDATRILTCVLDYESDKINVTDLLYELGAEGWKQKISSYQKIRILPGEIQSWLKESGFEVQAPIQKNRFVVLLAVKNNS